MKFKAFIIATAAVAVLMGFLTSDVFAQGMQVTSAKVYIKQNEWDKAEALLTEALAKDAEHRDANFFMGYVRYTQGRYEEMLDHWSKFEAKKLGRRERDIHKKTIKDLYIEAFNKGIEGFNAQDWPATISNFKVAVRLKPDKKDFQPETNLGFAQISAGELDDGIATLEIVIEADPKNADIWNGLLAGYIRKEDHKNIIRAYENYLPLINQHDSNDYYRLGRSHSVLGDTLKAAEVYEAAMEVVPEEMNFYLMSSEIHARFGNNNKAADILERAHKVDETDTKILNSLGVLYYIAKDYQKAISSLQKLVELEPLDIDGWQNLGDAFFGLASVANEAGDTAKGNEYTAKGKEYESKSKELMRTGTGK